jgi:type I restriction enzyme M protein
LQEHESGTVSWTAPRRPIEPIHWEVFPSRGQAVKREKELKTGFRRKWLKQQYSKGLLAAAARQAGAWVDERKTKIGYEINFNRYFYEYTPPRPLDEIKADLKGIEQEIADLLAEVTE